MMTFSLSTGAALPGVGFGFWKVEKSDAAEVAQKAISVGYRHLDCACDYGNEVEVGYGIAQAISTGLCHRDDLWVTSKLWNTFHSAEHVRMACEKSLQDLGLKQLDLYLIHFPIAQKYVPFETRYPPGWFFDPAAPAPGMEETRVPISETWTAMEKHRSAAQVLLRWGVQRGASVIPKTTNIARMKENLAIFDFELSPDEMHSISGLDRHRRFNDPGVFCESAFNTFCPIYE